MPSKLKARNHFKRSYLSLGSNLGDRCAFIRQALEMLSEKDITVVQVSSLYESEPVELRRQPWFINCVAEIKTTLTPRELLRACLSVERALGRRRTRPKGPRLIDIDIVLYENTVVRSPGLKIPHPRMTERRFVLVPLSELAPGLVHPATGETMAALLRRTSDVSKITRLKRQKEC